jgi:hypothetical protein
MLLSHHQDAGQNHDIKVAKISFENVAQFKYLGTKIRNQNMIDEEIKSASGQCLLPFSPVTVALPSAV